MRVFIDANSIIEAGKPPGGPLIDRLRDLVRAGLVEIVTTNISLAEVARRHTENEFKHIKDVGKPHFRALVEEYFDVEIPPIDGETLRQRIAEKYQVAVNQMFESLDAEILDVDAVQPSAVFTAYDKRDGFFSGEGKKDQFPDAFIFERLKQEASEQSPITIVSRDSDFEGPVAATEHFDLVKSIPDLFTGLGLSLEAPEIEDFLNSEKENLLGLINEELQNWGLDDRDIEDAYIEVDEATAVSFENITAFKSIDGEDDILVVGTMDIELRVSYTHPDWDSAFYDSEEKRLIPFDDISGNTEVNIKTVFSLSISTNDEGEPEHISKLRFRNNNGTFYIELYPYDPYDR